MKAQVIATAAAILVVGATQFAGAAGGNATLRTLARAWGGHDRGLTIMRTGRGTETILESCCRRVVTLRFRITRVWGTAQRPLAKATVTYVHVYDASWFSKKDPAPHVDEVGTLRIVEGVLYEPLGGDTYCNAKTPITQATDKCGA
jgi:hypothetical protein